MLNKRFNHLFIVLSLLSIFYLISASNIPESDGAKFKNYENPIYRYSLTVSSEWEKHLDNPSNVWFEPSEVLLNKSKLVIEEDDIKPIFYINVTNAMVISPLLFTQDDQQQWLENIYENKGYDDINIDYKNYFELGNNEGYHLEYQYKLPNFGKVKEKNILITTNGEKYYLLGFKAEKKEYDKLLPSIQNMMTSFKVEPEPLMKELTGSEVRDLLNRINGTQYFMLNTLQEEIQQKISQDLNQDLIETNGTNDDTSPKTKTIYQVLLDMSQTQTNLLNSLKEKLVPEEEPMACKAVKSVVQVGVSYIPVVGPIIAQGGKDPLETGIELIPGLCKEQEQQKPEQESVDT